MSHNTLNVTGKTFGRLRVLDTAPSKYGCRQLVCECSCGNIKTIALGSVVSGATRSCGCLRKEVTSKTRTTHGKSNSRVHRCWAAMRTRCNNKKSSNYRYYGGRGIKVCNRWRKFENFYADMGDPPIGHTLDRINNDGNYEPKNCKWSTIEQQHQNQRRNIKVTINSQTLCLYTWAKKLGLPNSSVQSLIQKGYSPKNALLHLMQK